MWCPVGVLQVWVTRQGGELHEVREREGTRHAIEFGGARVGDFLDDAEEVTWGAGGN